MISVLAHNPFMIGSNWGLVALRIAEGVEPASVDADDALNYYLGMAFNDTKKADEYWNKIPESSPFYPFILIVRAENVKSAGDLKKMVEKYPSFAPAVAKYVLIEIADSDFETAMNTVNHSLKQDKLSKHTQAYLLKLRAHLNYLQGEYYAAEDDINAASKMSPKDKGLIADKARIWAKMGVNLDEMYDLLIRLIKDAPGESDYWDALGCIMTARGEGREAAQIFERITRIDGSVSSYWEHAGDAFAADGQVQRAKNAYEKALELKSDGQINIREVRKKSNYLK
jgi:tetratricopeptide (TPR) repeat protein